MRHLLDHGVHTTYPSGTTVYRQLAEPRTRVLVSMLATRQVRQAVAQNLTVLTRSWKAGMVDLGYRLRLT